MDRVDLYRDIATRTQGDIYIGVVGPVRTGKSTFIKRFLDLLVLPGIENQYVKERVIDELPQSGSGKTIMTTQPKFVPNEAVRLEFEAGASVNVRLVDCVGYMVPGAVGHLESDAPRMVRTPWFDYDIPFEEAAEIGTRKVMADHSTIGVVMTTDGSITQIPRSAYLEAEERVVKELKALNKPFLIILNTTAPQSEDTKRLRDAMEEKYDQAVLILDVMKMSNEEAGNLLEEALLQFPMRELHLDLPPWMQALEPGHWLIQRLLEPLCASLDNVSKMSDNTVVANALDNVEGFLPPNVADMDLGKGKVRVQIKPEEGLFYTVLGEECGCEIRDDFHLVSLMKEYMGIKKEYDRISSALLCARQTGYGLVPPVLDEMMLEEPEIVQQGGRYGVKLKAKASGMHLIRVDVDSEVTPLVGTEAQSEEMAQYLTQAFERDPSELWKTNFFGKPLYELVREGMNSKIHRMPEPVQRKLQDTLQRIVNRGCNNLICIML